MPLIWKENTLNMDWCLSCHRKPAEFIRPPERVFDSAWDPESLSFDERQQLAERLHITSMTNCSVCHR